MAQEGRVMVLTKRLSEVYRGSSTLLEFRYINGLCLKSLVLSAWPACTDYCGCSIGGDRTAGSADASALMCRSGDAATFGYLVKV